MSGAEDFFDDDGWTDSDTEACAAQDDFLLPLRLGAGVHEISFAEYLADPCIEPSLRSGDIQRLLTETPRHFLANHPRHSPRAPRVDSARMDLGSIVHKLVLGKGDDVRVFPFNDWKTKAARQARDLARAEGCTPTLERIYARALMIADKAKAVLAEEFGAWPFGEAEQTFIWSEQVVTRQGDAVTVWCRTRPDITDLVTRALVIDVKSTEIVLSDDGVAGRLTEEDGRSLIQAAFQMRGVQAMRPDLAGRLSHCHAFVETKAPPYESRINDTSTADLELANHRCTRAMERYAEMLTDAERGPAGWPRRRLSAREWLMKKWLAEEEEAFS